MVSISSPANVRTWLTWSSIGLGATGLGQFVVLAVLARYLTAAEFGVVTATMIVVALGRALTHASIGPALVQRESLRPEHVRSAAALSLLSALAMLLAMWATAPAVAAFFHMDDLADVCARCRAYSSVRQSVSFRKPCCIAT